MLHALWSGGRQAKRAIINLNSPGGDPFAGNAIRHMLAKRTGESEVRNIGMVGSAATLIAMGAARLVHEDGTSVVIHSPRMLFLMLAVLTPQSIEQDVIPMFRDRIMRDLKGMEDDFAKSYADYIGMTPAAIRSMLLLEALWMAVLGVALGIGISWALMTVLSTVGISLGDDYRVMLATLTLDRLYPTFDHATAIGMGVLMIVAVPLAASESALTASAYV